MDKDVPYIVFEGQMNRYETTIKRLVTALMRAVATARCVVDIQVMGTTTMTAV